MQKDPRVNFCAQTRRRVNVACIEWAIQARELPDTLDLIDRFLAANRLTPAAVVVIGGFGHTSSTDLKPHLTIWTVDNAGWTQAQTGNFSASRPIHLYCHNDVLSGGYSDHGGIEQWPQLITGNRANFLRTAMRCDYGMLGVDWP